MEKKKIPLDQERKIESAFYDGFRDSGSPDWWMYVEAPKIEKIQSWKIRISTREWLTLFETSQNLDTIKNEIQWFLRERVERYERIEEKLKSIFWKNALVKYNIPLWNRERHISPVFNGNSEQIVVYLNFHLPTTLWTLKGNPFVTEKQIIDSICAKLDEKEDSWLDLPSKERFIEMWNRISSPLAWEDLYEFDERRNTLETRDMAKYIFEENLELFWNYLTKIQKQDIYKDTKAQEIAAIRKNIRLWNDEKRTALKEVETRYQKLIITQKEIDNLEWLFKSYFQKPPLEFSTKNPRFEVIELTELGSNKKVAALYVKKEDLLWREGAIVYFGKESKKFVSLPWNSETRQVSQLSDIDRN